MSSGFKANVPVGMRFGRLVIVKELSSIIYEGKDKIRVRRRFKCKCDCGNTVKVMLQNLRSFKTQSCGCWLIEVTKERKAKEAEESRRHHPLRMTYHNMNERCYNQNADSYKYYGGRGIRVCPEWRKRKGSHEAFKRFIAWAEDNGWSEGCGLQLDRVDCDKDYKPANCTWSTKSEQARNKRTSRLIRIKGQPWQVDNALEKFGVDGLKKVTLLKRLNTGWKPWDALTTPVAENMSVQARNRVDSRFIVYKGTRLQIDDAREKYGVSGLKRATLEHRLRSGWSVEKALETPTMELRNKPNSVMLKIGKKEYQIDEAIEHFKSTVNKKTICKRLRLNWPHKKALMQPARTMTYN